MIIGIGTDLIEVERVKRAILKERFFFKVFTKMERELILQNTEKAAGNFAGKEAVVKMFGTGFGKIQPIEIEVLRKESGAPYVVLHGAAKEYAQLHKINKIHISLTNTKGYASAFVIGET